MLARRLLAGVMLPCVAGAAPIEISVGVSDGLAPQILEVWKQHPGACDQDAYFSADWPRTMLEFFILCRAVRLGGVEATYRLENYPNSVRTRFELIKGTVMTMVDLPWGDFADDDRLYKSSAVLPVGSFVKGIYVRPDHAAILHVASVAALREYTAVSSRNWVYDWAALERMGVKTINVARYDQMGAMVERGAADFLVDEFPGGEDLSQYINNVRFVPVPGIKVVLLGSRHIAVAKRVPHARQVFDAIQRGLAILRDRGLIRKGYQVSGFFNPKVAAWNTLCCEE